MMSHPAIRRLAVEDLALARETFRLMVDVFEEEEAPVTLGDAYLARLLAREDFWAFVATVEGRPVGGLTAHALPMTRREATELFLYDLAVHASHQRRGIGRSLVEALLRAARDAGISSVFVPADNDDGHALDFYRAIGGDAAPVTIFTFE